MSRTQRHNGRNALLLAPKSNDSSSVLLRGHLPLLMPLGVLVSHPPLPPSSPFSSICLCIECSWRTFLPSPHPPSVGLCMCMCVCVCIEKESYVGAERMRCRQCCSLWCVAMCCNVLRCNVLRCIASVVTSTHLNILQNTATHCNTLQHTATHHRVVKTAYRPEIAGYFPQMSH